MSGAWSTWWTVPPGESWLLATCTLLLFALPAPTRAAAQQVSARAYLTPEAVGLNRQFVLNVEVNGAQRTDAAPELPDIASFARYLGVSSSTSMQIVHGVTTVSLTLQYRYQATEVGTFDVGAVAVRAGGRVLETEPVTLTVSDAPRPAPGPGATPQGQAAVPPEDLFVVAEVSPRRVYENESVLVRYRLFTRVDVGSYSVTQTAGNEGFWVEGIPQAQNPAVEQIVRDGVPYATAVLRESVLFPTGPGTKTIEPLTVEASVRVRRRSLGPFEDFFNRGSLFGAVVPAVAASEPVDVEVLPLPEAGRPESFTGLVGRLDVTASLARSDVQTNEAVTLLLTVSGEGNLRVLAAPDLALSGDFEVFPPEVSESIDRRGNTIGGTKTYEYVLIPRTPGEKTIPSIEVAYFDAGEEAYETSSTAALALAVTGDAIAIAPGVRTGVETLREDIRFIQVAPPRLAVADRSLFDTVGFWIVALLPLLVLISAGGVRWHQDRLEGDVAYARGRRAARVARKRLAQARSLLSGDDVRGFYAEVESALRGFLADKLNVAEAGFMSETAEFALLERGVALDTVREYLECLGACDRARFAPPGSGDEERASFLERAAGAMTAVQEGLP